MLMSGELHNWLLLMDLKLASRFTWNRPGGLFSRQFRKGFSIPQAFPQVASRNCGHRQL
jgi:hypothetical protein